MVIVEAEAEDEVDSPIEVVDEVEVVVTEAEGVDEVLHEAVEAHLEEDEVEHEASVVRVPERSLLNPTSTPVSSLPR